MNNDLISREDLKKEIKEQTYQFEQIPIRVDKVISIIDNAPTVPLPDFKEGYKQAIIDGKTNFSRPQGECENCDFRKFSETFIDGVVDVMNKNGITSVEQLSELLKGGAELYREETCKSKDRCDDYKYWHCAGCNGCKKGGAENDT